MPEKPKLTKISNPFKNKKLKYGGASVIFTAAFIAAVVLINIIAGMLFDRFGAKIDLTQNRLYTIEDMTANYLRDLSDNVTVTVASREADFVAPHVTYYQTNEIIKKFAQTSPKITVNYIDLLSNPAFANRYENLTATSIVVESANTGRYKVLGERDYLAFEYYDYMGNQLSAEEYSMYAAAGMASMDVSAAAENALLSAFLSVTDLNPIYVGVTSGFGEAEGAELSNLLATNAYVLNPLNLITNDIPENTDFIIIYSPEADYSVDALSKLDAWLDNGGKYGKTLVYITPYTTETPNTDSFLRDWGVEVERSVVDQFDSKHASFVGTQMIQQFQPTDTDYAKGVNRNYNIYASYMRPVNLLDSKPSTIETRALITTYEDAVLFPFDELQNEQWEPKASDVGTWNVAVEAWKTRYEGNTPYRSRVIVFGGYVLLDDYFLKMQNANNADFFINMMNFVSGKENVIKLSPKSFAVASFNISAGESGLIGFIFAIALPVAIIAAGVVIWVKRRYR